MSFLPFAFSKAKRLRGVVANDAGNTEYVDWSNPAELTLPEVNIQPAMTTENDVGERDTIIDEWKLFTSGAADIRNEDRIVHNGVTYEVQGQPMAWPSPFDGSTYYTEARLRRYRG